MPEISIGIAIITRQRIDQLKRLLPQLSKFDQVVVCDTGSQDGTERYVRSLGKPFQYEKFTWRDKPTKAHRDFGFSAARNASFSYLKTTHAIWLDTDDVIGYVRDNKQILATPDQAYGVFKKLATEAPEEVDVWMIQYVYSRDANGNPNAIHHRERMVKLSTGWRWVYPVHENLVPSKKPNGVTVKDLDIIHMPTKIIGDSSERNIKLLNTWLAQLDENDPDHELAWCRLNIGDTLFGLEKYKECAEFLIKEFISKHPESMSLEKWHAWCRVAQCQAELYNFEAAKMAALASIDLEPGLSDGYILLAQIKMSMDEDPQDILTLLDVAGRQDEAPVQMITNPLFYHFTPACIISDCKFQLGQFDAALDWALKAQKMVPSDDRAEALRVQAADAVRRRDAAEAAKALYRLLQDYEENEKAGKLYELLPYVAQQNSDIQNLAQESYERIRHMFDRKEYIKLYEQNSRWEPAKEEWIDNESPEGIERYQYILGRLKAALPKGGRILDVGCSDGFHSMLYAKHGYEVVGVDLDPRAVELANERAEKRGLSAKFVHGFFEDMEPSRTLDPFDPERHWFENFDAVICSEVIEHVQDPALLLGCLGDCAKNNAPIIVTTPNEAFDKGDTAKGFGMHEENTGMSGHVRAYTQETFEALLRSNSEFDVVEARFVPFMNAYRKKQGWQCGEIRRRARSEGPVIRIFCGDVVDFTPDDVNTGGIGGSETAVVYMAKAWASMGCQVIVYGGVNGIYDGVYYRMADRYYNQNRSDVFIGWRLPTAFQYGRPNATTTIFWAHDLFYPIHIPGYAVNEIPQKWADGMDYVMVLSEFHKKVVERIHPTLKGKTFVTRNGIDPYRFVGKDIKKVPHRYFYSSSYDRGLEELLEVWPEIKKAIPDAELHVAYGVISAEAYFRQTGERHKLDALYKLLGKMKSLPGVVHHERIGQGELADIQLSCEAWLYPYQPDHESGAGGFLETYCITALEAQAARCMIVCRKNGALPETVKHAIWWDENTDIVDILTNPDNYWKPEWSEKNYRWAIDKTWNSLAVEWGKTLSKREEVVTV